MRFDAETDTKEPEWADAAEAAGFSGWLPLALVVGVVLLVISIGLLGRRN